MAGGVGGDDEEYIQLNLTAMVDVVMLLIIFFVSNLAFPKAEGSLPADLPKSAGVAKPGEKPPTIDKIVIGMDVVGMGKREDEDGGKKVVRDAQVIRVIVNNQPMKMESLEAKLFSLQRQIPDAEITLDVKPNVWYENVVQVFNICARNHFTKVAFAQPAPGQ